MLVGGPNSGLNDAYVQNVLKGSPSAKCYADNSQSYSTNEITIYWNSPLIYLLAAEKNSF
jgi:endoglucanase